MVDASTGGKTGINFNHIKNTIGTFTEPDAVVIHEPFLKSLADVEMRSGFAEVLKHILLSDGERWKKLIEEQAISPREIINSDIILSSISFKKKITGEDFYDKGLRKILNFGHTIGHALEGVAASKSENLRHGEAVAAGMVAELFLSNKLSGFPYEEMNRSTKYIVSVFHDFNIPSSMNSIFDFLKTDKKNEGERIAFSLLKSPGQPAGIYFPDEETIKSSLDFMISEFSLTSVDDKNH
jgi:3-dehydroquinate synthase